MEVPNCPKCGSDMVERSGKYGRFLGCSTYPKCRGTRQLNDNPKPTFGKKEVKEFKPSKFQEAIFEFVKSGEGNAVVEAVAGSGKTTTIVKALEFTPKDAKVAFVAFNTAIARELQDRAPQHVEVRTLHSLGLKNISNWLGVKPQIEEGKVKNILSNLLETEEDWEMLSPLCKAISLAKGTLMEPTFDAFEEMCDRYGIETNGQATRMFQLTLRTLEVCKAQSGVVDFDDMIWENIVLNIPAEKYDCLFVDECLPYHMPILLSDGSSLPIGKIVENRLPVEALSYDIPTKTQRPCQVVGWHKIPNSKPLVKVSVRRLRNSQHGPRSYVVCTTDHKIWADGRWIKARDLKRGMVVQVETQTEHTQKYKIGKVGQHILAEKIRKTNKLGKTGGNIPPKGTWSGERGGNGARLPYPQQILLEALGDGWVAEYCVATGVKRYGSWKVGYTHSKDLPVNYKIDIANPSCKIAVEVDGEGHRNLREIDEKKDNFLKSAGWTIFRISNRDAVSNLDKIVQDITSNANCPTDYYVYSVESIDINDYFVYDLSIADCHNFYANGVLVHNCQDLNKAQVQLVLRSVNDNGRVVAVGDRNQSIYGFRGADVDAIPNIISALSAKTLPLSISYRCPKSHVEMAQAFVPELEAAPNAKEGTIDYLPLIQALPLMKDGNLVLCRCNAPLIEVAYALIRSGQKTVMRGRDIGQGLVSLVNKMKAKSISEFWSKLRVYEAKETAKLLSLEKFGQLEALQDRIETIIVIGEDVDTVDELIMKIETLFSDSIEGVVCSSVHRAKGLESDRVLIVRSDLMPHPMAERPWELVQEKNLQYVVLTRSKEELIFVE